MVTYYPRHGRRCSKRSRTRPAGACSTSCSSEDGQTLSALEQRLPMTRFGVMKHLKVLEEAGLVVTQAARPREAALPEPRPDPARPRPVGEQIRRALGRGAQRAQERTSRRTRWRRCSRSTSRRRRSASGRRSPTARCGRSTPSASAISSDWTPGSRYEAVAPGGGHRDQRGREPRGRSAAPARPELHGAVGRRREERGHLAGHLGDRAGRRLVPADRDPRPAARGRQRRALRRLADDPLRPEDAAGDGRAADHARLAALLGRRGIAPETPTDPIEASPRRGGAWPGAAAGQAPPNFASRFSTKASTPSTKSPGPALLALERPPRARAAPPGPRRSGG